VADTPQLGFLVMDDGREFGDAACAWASTMTRSSVRLGIAGSPDRDGLRTAAVAPPQQFNLETAVATVAEEGLFWVLAPRTGGDALSRIVDAATGAARVLDDAHPGFAIAFLGSGFGTARRIGAVADLRDPVTSGLSAWAAVGLALRLRADLDVLVLGAHEDAVPPASPEEALELFEIKGSGWQTTVDAVERARSHGVPMRWVPLGSPTNRAGAILRAIEERSYDIVVDDLPPINVGPKIGRRRRVQAALAQAGSGATAYRLLRDAPCDVVIVLDAVRMGLLPDDLLRSGVAAAVVLGVMGASTAAAASPQVPTTAAMPAAADPAESAVAMAMDASAAVDLSTMTADDLAVMRGELSVLTAERDATAAHIVELQTQHGSATAQLDAVAAEQARVETELEPLRAEAEAATAASNRLALSTIGPLGLLPFTPTQEEAEQARAAAQRAQEALDEVQVYADALAAQQQDLNRTQTDLAAHITEGQHTLAAQQAQVDALAQLSADLAWTLHPVTIPVAGDQWEISAWFGDRGSLWSLGWHTGLDFAAPTGTPIVAAKDGTVVEAGWAGAYGKTVVVQHADGTKTLYAHLHTIEVGVGQTVALGQQIGTLGSTGNSTGPHLHFEVIDPAGNWVDPAVWLGIR
jgi:murein DD-endopeptidase MepM/ murein hydrolase activator NlpD